MSSPTWTPRAVASSAAPARLALWRAVDAQHVVATMALVDTLDEQLVLERLLDASKPPPPAGATRLHDLLFTPFRDAPPPGGSRCRGCVDPGVFYGADAVRTACAELGYWRWRHLLDSPAMTTMPARPQAVFRVAVASTTVDLRAPPFVRDRAAWTSPVDYGPCQRFAAAARAAAVGVIRYESVRDPEHGGCAAVLDWRALSRSAPTGAQTWLLSVTRERVVWQRADARRHEAFEFSAQAFGHG
ncbi:MAG: RES family NAD+ phosphorylase [Burkholderiales bacterium]|nr:RES family NAD+ phosphorylase [Burkholderiales bacterium]